MKPWYQSKTLWLNAASVLFGLATTLAPQVSVLMTPTRFAVYTIVVAALNGALRFVTDQGITLGSTAEKS